MLPAQTSAPPFDRDYIWACPVCGFVAPQQYGDHPGECPFSWRGGGPTDGFKRHPYGKAAVFTDYAKARIKRAED